MLIVISYWCCPFYLQSANYIKSYIEDIHIVAAKVKKYIFNGLCINQTL